MAIADAILGKVFRRRRCRTDQDVCTNRTSSAVKDLPLAGDKSRSHSNQPQLRQDGIESNGRDTSIFRSGHRYGSRSLSAQVAAIKTLFPDRESLPASHQRSLSTDLENLKPLDDKEDRRPHSESTSNRRFMSRSPRNIDPDRRSQLSREQWATLHPTKRLHRSAGPSVSGSPDSLLLDRSNISATRDMTSQNAIQSGVHPGSLVDGPAPLHFQKRTSVNVRPHTVCSPILAYEERRCTLSRKHDICDLRNASEPGHVRRLSLQTTDNKSRSRNIRRSSITCSHLDKPLPPIPLEIASETEARPPSDDAFRLGHRMLHPDPQHSQVGSGSGDCDTKVDTTFYKRWSPGVTHETITRRVHEVREEHISREIHNHHVYHRTLPIIDVELLPTRHFIHAGSGYVEVAEEDIPAEMRPTEDWLRSETVSKLLPDNDGDNLSGRSPVFNSDVAEDNVKENVTPDGIKRNESTCIHPPILEPGVVDTEQAYAVRLNIEGGLHDSSLSQVADDSLPRSTFSAGHKCQERPTELLSCDT